MKGLTLVTPSLNKISFFADSIFRWPEAENANFHSEKLMAKLTADQALLRAKSYEKGGQFEEARRLYRSVLKAFPKNKKAKRALTRLEQPNTAAVSSQDPPQETLNQLIAHYNREEFAPVVDLAGKLTAEFPGSFVLWNILGAAAAQIGKNPVAEKGFRRASDLKPDFPAAQNNLANILKEQGKLDEAIAAYHRALSLKPDFPEAHHNLGVVLQEQGKIEEAIAAFTKALSLKPDYPEAHNNLGNAFLEQGRADDAIAAYGDALSVRPNYAKAHKNLGKALLEQGRADEAIAAYTEAVTIKPDYADAHRHLSHLKKFQIDDPQIAQMEDLYGGEGLSDEQRCHFCFALSKAYEDIGQLKKSFDLLKEGNALRKAVLNYQFLQDESLFEDIKRASETLLHRDFQASFEPGTTTPIFIVGMPRSGTTLVEQIVSSHSDVTGSGELNFVTRYGKSMAIGSIQITPDRLDEFRNRYAHEIIGLSGGMPFVIDKMPHNFRWVGLISRAFPEAKIIHVKRDPAATCWSNFKQYFTTNGLGYSYDLEDLVRYYGLYENLMAFWHEHLPDCICTVDYERLTLDQERETKKLINFLGLSWEDACLSPHRNPRDVKTASQLQVRQEVYQGSSDKWRKFEPFLEGAFDQLV